MKRQQKRSNDSKSTNMQKTQVTEGPMTRSKTKELAKQSQLQKLYSNLVENSAQNNCAQQTSVHKKKMH